MMHTPTDARATRSRIWPAVISLMLFAVLFPTTAQAQDQADKPNLLFIFLDDFAPDAIGALGNPDVKTDALDELVRQSTSFSSAYNQGAWTGAVCRSSRDMLESGLFLWNAQDDAVAQIRAGDGATNLIRDAGYHTYFAGKQHMSGGLTPSELGYETVGTVRPAMPTDYQIIDGAPASEQAADYYGANGDGFAGRPLADGSDTWDPTDPSLGGFWEIPDPAQPDEAVHWAEVLADDGVDFLETAKGDDRPFYIQLSFNAPHDPRQAPAEYLDMYDLDSIEIPANSDPQYNAYIEALGLDTLRDELVAPSDKTDLVLRTHLREYYAAISHLDAQVAKVMDKLTTTEQRDDTYVILAGDHGLAVGQHGLMGKQNMFEHSVRTPLLISGPGIDENVTSDALVYYQDVIPTMFDLAGVSTPVEWQFRSLVPILNGDRADNYDAVYAAYDDNAGRPAQRMVVQDRHKLILYPELSPPVALLYDLESDPLEMSNLVDDPAYTQRRVELFDALVDLQADTGDDLELTYPFTEISSRTVEVVEAEDYTAATDTDPENLGGAPEFPAPADVWPHANGPDGQREGHVVGRTRGGETLSYDNISLAEGQWEVSASWASGDPDPGGMDLYVDDRLVGSFEATSGHWWVFESSSFGTVDLTAGPHDLRVEFTDAGQINFDYLELTRIGDRSTWTIACPTSPSWVRVGDSTQFTAVVEPAEILPELSLTWDIAGQEVVGPFEGELSSPPITWESATDGQATPIGVSATDGVQTRSASCPGLVAVEPGASVVSPGEDLQQAITTARAGATVYLDRGVHIGNVNVRPLAGQTIAGFVDSDGTSLLSTLDGTGTEAAIGQRRAAFLSNPGEDHPQGVTIRDLEFTNWTTFQDPDGSLERSGFHGVIHVQSATTTPRDIANCTAARRDPTGWGDPIDWTIDGVHIHDNDGAGIVLSSGVTVRDSLIADNAHLGIGGTFVKDALVENVTVRRNALHPDVVPNNHAGGLKITRANGLQILSSEFTGNGGPGIWLDIDTWGNRVINNVASDNTTYGIFQEISWASSIQSNTALNNGIADILVAESGGFLDSAGTTITLNAVDFNRLSDADVTTRNIDRSCDYDIFRAADGNTIVPSTAITGYALQHNRFSNNGPDAPGENDGAVPGPWVPSIVFVDGAPPIPGADGPIHAMVTTTCLAENGRVDINIVNTGTDEAVYRIEFGGLSPRQRTVDGGDWWRMPITGRPDGPHDLRITRNGSVVRDEPVTVSCDSAPAVINSPEIQVVNACRDGRGYIIFQFANPTETQRSWVIGFQGVQGRSTSAPAYGGSVRAVTGRQNGTYVVVIRSGAETTNFKVTVDC